MRVGLYPGSFDPVTHGHVDVVRRAAHFVDRLVIAIGAHHDKHGLFTTKERVKLATEVLGPVARKAGLEPEPPSSSEVCATPTISITRCRWRA